MNRSDDLDKHKLQLAVIDSHIEHAERDGYSTPITLHALNVLRQRYAELLEERENYKMTCLWAKHLVGNKNAFETACEKWHESLEKQIIQ